MLGSSNGKLFFAGEVPFKNGGPSCLACHNAAGLGVIGGGTVGKELTFGYLLIGEAGGLGSYCGVSVPLARTGRWRPGPPGQRRF